MKKVLVFVLITAILVSTLSFILADDNSTVTNSTDNLISPSPSNTTEVISNDTENQTKIMHEHRGARVRVLQLQKSIKRMILHAEAIKTVVANKGNDTTELENIIVEMKLLLDEAENITTNDLNTTVQQFVDIKEDAIILRKEFRDTAKKYLTKEDKKALIEEFKKIDRAELEGYKERIRNEIREFNKKRIERLINITRCDAHNLNKRIRNNETNTTEALKECKEKYKSMSHEEKEQIKENIRGNITREILEKREAILKIKQKRAENISERAQERADKLSEMGKPIALTRMHARSEIFSNRAEKIEERRNAINTRLQNGN